LIATWLILGAVAAPPPEDTVDFGSAMDQAHFFLGRERFAEAQEQLELAVRTPEGARDAETWFLLAKVRYERGRLAGAEAAADQARRFSRNPSEFSQTQELYAFFRDRFGTLVIDGPSGARTPVALELTSTELDPELKAYVARWNQRLAQDDALLPFSLGVPVGSYRVNGQVAVIEAGRTTTLDDAAVPRSGLGALAIDVALGGASWSRDGRASGLGEVAVTVPFDALRIGLVGQGVAHRSGPDDAVETSLGITVGARAGWAIGLGHPWVLVTAVNARVGSLPGVALGCQVQGCTPEPPNPVASVRVPATALFVGPELRASYERTAHWRVGFVVSGERALGRLPAEVQVGGLGTRPVLQRGIGVWTGRLAVSVGYRL